MNIKVTVEQGGIAVNSVFVMQESKDSLILEVDCSSKYPQPGPISLAEISLVKGKETMHGADTDKLTVIHVEGIPSGWMNDITVGRYNALIFFWKPSEFGQVAWEAS